MNPIFTALSPNAEWDDIELARKILFHPHTWKEDQWVNLVEDWFKTYLDRPYAAAFESGRTCLSEVLASQNIKEGDEVLLQAYTCVAVPNPILWTGARPIYVDIDPQTLTMSVDDLKKKITPRSRVLIIQHTFGQPADIDRLMEIARSHFLFVIEDCAHALGATYHGQPVGSFGDASFFSFGRDKVVSSIAGGIACVRDPSVAQHLFAAQQRYSYPPSSWVVQYLLHPLVCEGVKRTYPIGLGKYFLYAARKTRLIAPPVEAVERHGGRASFLFHRFSPALAQLALHQLKKLERFNQHRRKIAAIYQHELDGSHFQVRQPLPDSTPIYLRFTTQHPARDEIMQDAKRQCIFLGDWYATSIAPAGTELDRIGYTPCPVAESLAEQTLNLPTDIHITEQAAKRILSVLHPYL